MNANRFIPAGEIMNASRFIMSGEIMNASRFKRDLHLLSFAENRRERIFTVNIDEKALAWFTLASIFQENVKKM